MAWLSNWKYRIKIIIDHSYVDDNLLFFPVMVKLDSNQDAIFTEIGLNKYKIAVTKDDGVTQVYAEIAYWDSTNQTAKLFVSRNDLLISKDVDSLLYLYFDNSQPDNINYVGITGQVIAQQVWDSNFIAVWHMSQELVSGSESLYDSTSYVNHGTPYNMSSSNLINDIGLGKCLHFNGSDTRIEVPVTDSLNEQNKLTVEIHFKTDQGGTNTVSIVRHDGHFTPMQLAGGTNYCHAPWWTGGNVYEVNFNFRGAYNDDNWHYYIVTYDSSDKEEILIDRASKVTATSNIGPLDTTTKNFILGATEGESEFFEGELIEVRFSKTIRSEAWRNTSNYNLANVLLSLGEVENYYSGNFRKKITISGSTGAGTGYQVFLKVGESSGAVDYDFHVEGKSTDFPSGKGQGGDLSFIADDGFTQLSFWVEEVSGGIPNRVAKIWVKVIADLETDQDIYCCYGNNDSQNNADGDSTFIIFDDFEGINLNVNKWTVEKRGSTFAIVELDGNGNLHLAGASKIISSGNVLSTATITNNFLIRSRRKYTDQYYTDLSVGNGILQDSDEGGTSLWWHTVQGDGYFFLNQADKHKIAKIPSGEPFIELIGSTDSWGEINEFEIEEYSYTNNGTLKWVHNGEKKFSVINTDYLTTLKYLMLSQGEYSNGNGGDQYIDYIFVRNYIDIEPSFSSASIEEYILGSLLICPPFEKNSILNLDSFLFIILNNFFQKNSYLFPSDLFLLINLKPLIHQTQLNISFQKRVEFPSFIKESDLYLYNIVEVPENTEVVSSWPFASNKKINKIDIIPILPVQFYHSANLAIPLITAAGVLTLSDINFQKTETLNANMMVGIRFPALIKTPQALDILSIVTMPVGDLFLSVVPFVIDKSIIIQLQQNITQVQFIADHNLLTNVFQGIVISIQPFQAEHSFIGVPHIAIILKEFETIKQINTNLQINFFSSSFITEKQIPGIVIYNGNFIVSKPFIHTQKLIQNINNYLALPALNSAHILKIPGISSSFILPNFKHVPELIVKKVIVFQVDLANIYYFFTLTGQENGLSDVEIPISSFQASIRNGTPSYLQVVIPGIDYANAISDRPDGTMQIYMAYKLLGQIVRKQLFIEANLETIRLDKGVKNIAITLTGHKTETYTSKDIIIKDVIYESITGPKYKFRFAEPIIDIHPGDNITVGNVTFIADLIVYYVKITKSGIVKTMEVSQ